MALESTSQMTWLIWQDCHKWSCLPLQKHLHFDIISTLMCVTHVTTSFLFLPSNKGFSASQAQKGFFLMEVLSFHKPRWFSNCRGEWHEQSIYVILQNSNPLKYMKHFPFFTKEKYSKIERSKSLQRLDLGQKFQRSAEQHKIYQKWVEPYTTPQQNLQGSIAFL